MDFCTVGDACLCTKATNSSLPAHSETAMAAPSARGMLWNGGLQQQEGLRGHRETGGDRVACPSPVAGTQWGQARVFLPAVTSMGHTALPACSQQHRSLHQPQGSCLGAGLMQDVVVSCMQVLGDCRSNQQPSPWASLANSWLLGVHSDHHKLHASMCFLVPVCPGEKLHVLICPSVGDATKSCQWAPAGMQAAASVRLLRFGEGCGESWPYRNLSPTPCSPGASETAPGRAPAWQSTWEMCKRCWGRFQVRRVSGCPSPRSPASAQALGERESPCPEEGGAMEDSQQRREVVSVSNLGS